MATCVGPDWSPLGGGSPGRTCCGPSGQCLPLRASSVLLGLAGRLGAATPNPQAAPFTGGKETQIVGGVPRRDASSVGGSGVGLDLRSGEDGLRHRRPRVARLLRTPCRIPAGVLLPWFLWVRRSGRRLDLPVPFSARSVCVCVCVCACACVCVARSLPGSHSAGTPSPPARSRPFHVASTWSLWTTSGTPTLVPSEFAAGVWGPGRVHIWTHGHILLTAAFRREKVFAHLVGHFQLLLMNRFFLSQ